MNKRTLISALIGLNVVLLVLVILSAYPPSSANAQAVGGGANFVMLTGEAQADTDVLYLLDLANRNLHVLGVQRAGPRLALRWLGGRSLERDLRR